MLRQMARHAFGLGQSALRRWTPYELHRITPEPSLEPGRLALAHYLQTGGTGPIVQIGACDGRGGDPYHDLIRGSGVPAVVVEPVPASFRALAATYADCPHVTPVRAAIATHNGEARMYRIRDAGRWEGDPWAPQVASFSRDHILSHGARPDEVETVTVPARTLRGLLVEAEVRTVGFLIVDVEGFDDEVVRQALTLRRVPDYISFEHVHLRGRRAGLCTRLEAEGYEWVSGRWDTLAVHRRVTARWTNGAHHTPPA